jgi:hypothetical protein
MIQFREVTERFRLEKILKSTRATNVLRASDLAAGTPAVVKLLSIGRPADPQAAVERFLAFAETLAGLQHSSLPKVYDFGVSADGSAWLALEAFEGRAFESLSGGPSRRVLPLLDAVAEGLEVLSVHGLSHRNLTPDNLFLVPADQGGIKILGLGSALFRSPGLPPEPATLRFRAPEERDPAAPEPATPARTDVFSLVRSACQVLGTTVYYEDTPEPQLEFPPSFKFELDEFDPLRMAFQAALRRDPVDRPSLSRLRSALRRAVGAPEPPLIRARPAVPPAPVPPPAPVAPVATSLPPLGPAAALPAIPSAAATAPAAAAAPRPAAGPAPAAAPRPAGPALEDTGDGLPALDDTGGELLATIDDDLLLDASTPPPPVPAVAAGGRRPAPAPAAAASAPRPQARPRPAAAGATNAPSAAPAAATAVPAPRSGPAWRRPLPLALAAVGLVLVIALAWWLLAGGTPPPPPVAAVVAKPAPPRVPPTERLAAAFAALDGGEDLRALELLHSLTGEDQVELGLAACRSVRVLEDTLGRTVPARLAADLAGGLEEGDVALIRRAVQAADSLPGLTLGAAEQAGQDPSAAAPADLEKARQVVALYAAAEAADKAENPLGVLEQFGAMATLLGHDVGDTTGLRDRAAQAVESAAEGMLREARYDDALAHLAPLTRTWPDRPGLADKVKSFQKQKDDEARVSSLLTSAEATERRKKPDEGLALLRGVTPTAHLEERYRNTVGRLEALLAQVDRRPPEVELREGILQYDRGTFINLSFRVKDDFKVEDVKVYGRRQGGKFQTLSAQKDRFAYTVEISPTFHQNETVEVYVVATDVSGHQGTLGAREQPLKITRRKSFREG